MGNLILVRHGQASYLSDNYDRLSDLGRKQAILLGQYFNAHNIRFTNYFTGPLERQRDTLSLITEAFDIKKERHPERQILPQLREHKAPQLLRKIYPDLITEYEKIRNLDAAIKSDPSLQRKNSILIYNEFIKLWISGQLENLPEYDNWIDYKTEVNSIVTEMFTRDHDTLVVTSGGTKTAIISEILNLKNNNSTADINIHMKNTSISKFKVSADGISMISMNELPHLQPDLHTYV